MTTMTATIDTNAFRVVLETMRFDLSDQHGLRESLAVEASPDDLDRIQQASDRDFAVSKLQRNASQLQGINDALLRIQAGTFGTCVSCEEIINPRRLAAIPWAPFCITCQEAADSEQDMSSSEVGAPYAARTSAPYAARTSGLKIAA